MIIGEDAITRQGKLVFSRGTRLHDESIQMLKAWGIPEVTVLDQGTTQVNGTTLPEAETHVNTETEQKVQTRFKKSNTDHPAIQELMRLAVHSHLP